MKTKYAIIENEYFALESLKKIITQLRPEYELSFISESIEQTVSFFKQDKDTKIIFMDIELVDGNCFEIFNQVQIDIPIIFTTAYNDFAIQAFEVNSVDYILKPIAEISVEKALNKFDKIGNRTKNTHQIYEKLESEFVRNKMKKRILTSSGDHYSFIETKDVAYFISEDKYIMLVSFAGKKHFTTYQNLNQTETELDLEQFFRISRNLIVNINSIQNVSKYHNSRLILTIDNPEGENFHAIISAARKDDFLKFLAGDYP